MSVAVTDTPLWRAQSDMVNSRLVERWLPRGMNVVLKSDLFDEFATQGLYPALERRARRVVGIDLSPSVVAAASRRHPGLEGTVADVRDMPFAGGSFDAAVSNSTLDHLHSAEEVTVALREIHRVLRPGGRLVVTLDNPLNPVVALRNLLPPAVARALGPALCVSAWTCGPRSLSRLLRRSGFDLLNTTAVLHFPRVLVAAADARSSGLGRRTRVSSSLRRAETLERWPTRFITGHFVAALAVRSERPT